MKYLLLPKAVEMLSKLSPHLQKKFWKQVRLLLNNSRHPSLRAKKYDESENIWQARIDDHYRFYFKIEKDIYVIIKLRAHTD